MPYVKPKIVPSAKLKYIAASTRDVQPVVYCPVNVGGAWVKS